MKVKDINSVNTTILPGRELISIIMYDTFDTSLFSAKSQFLIGGLAGHQSGAVHQYLA